MLPRNSLNAALLQQQQEGGDSSISNSAAGMPSSCSLKGDRASTGSTGLPAYGMTNSDGMFVVTSVRGGRVAAGAVAGDYIVTVQKKRTANEADIGINITRQEYEKQKLDHKKYEYFQPVIQVVPTAYNAADSSGMRVIVKKGRNTGPGFHFDLSPGFKGK